MAKTCNIYCTRHKLVLNGVSHAYTRGCKRTSFMSPQCYFQHVLVGSLLSSAKWHVYTHTHTHIYIYIYVCVCIYVYTQHMKSELAVHLYDTCVRALSKAVTHMIRSFNWYNTVWQCSKYTVLIHSGNYIEHGTQRRLFALVQTTNSSWCFSGMSHQVVTLQCAQMAFVFCF